MFHLLTYHFIKIFINKLKEKINKNILPLAVFKDTFLPVKFEGTYIFRIEILL